MDRKAGVVVTEILELQSFSMTEIPPEISLRVVAMVPLASDRPLILISLMPQALLLTLMAGVRSPVHLIFSILRPLFVLPLLEVGLNMLTPTAPLFVEELSVELLEEE